MDALIVVDIDHIRDDAIITDVRNIKMITKTSMFHYTHRKRLLRQVKEAENVIIVLPPDIGTGLFEFVPYAKEFYIQKSCEILEEAICNHRAGVDLHFTTFKKFMKTKRGKDND